MAILSWSFRILLLVGSVTVFAVISRCIKKRKMQMRDGIFWIVMSFLLILVSAFPVLAVWAAEFIGIQSPSNCVFFLIIFFLGCHQFYLTIRISKLDMKNSKLTQHVAIQKTLEDEGEEQ
ncbi:MAG: DUF2304 domain-containing protein [Eubacteriales bacterium]|nr:DUF2304 domain-containing protein [Eubacteriales bacterium]